MAGCAIYLLVCGVCLRPHLNFMQMAKLQLVGFNYASLHKYYLGCVKSDSKDQYALVQ